MNNAILVKVENIQVQFGEHIALRAVSALIERGQIVTLIGPNGAGKSTLVRVILGLLKPHQGVVYHQPQLRLGYLPQRLHIDTILPLTVRRFLTLSNVKELATIEQVLTELNVLHLLNRPLQRISGGELQRVLLSRALLRQPDLLVLDEPMQGVDVSGQYELYEIIANLRQQRGCSVLMVSHDLHLVMAATDSVICLNRHVCCSGHPETVSQHPAYLALFGSRAQQELAFYTHHHRCTEHPFDEQSSQGSTQSVLPKD